MGNYQRRNFGIEFLLPDQSLELRSFNEGDAAPRLKDRKRGRKTDRQSGGGGGLLEMAPGGGRGRSDGAENENKQISAKEGDP